MRTFSWTVVLGLLSAVQCQNTGQTYQVDVNRDTSASRSQLMNTLLTVAAANGALPDIPAIQKNDPREKPKTLNLIQLSPNQRQQDPIVVQPNNQAIVTPLYSYQNIPLQTTFTPGLTQSNVWPQADRDTRTYPPASWQTSWQQEPATPTYTNEISPSDDLPMNLQINMPPQTPPQITVVSASPNRSPDAPCHPCNPCHPPIVIDRSDSLNNLLPMMLIALIANDRDCCCCNGNVIPIPYPIPFPVNSVINNSKRADSSNEEDDR